MRMGATFAITVWFMCLSSILAFLIGTWFAAEPKDRAHTGDRRRAGDRRRSQFVLQCEGVTLQTDDATVAMRVLADAREREAPHDRTTAQAPTQRIRTSFEAPVPAVSPVEIAIDLQRLRRVGIQSVERGRLGLPR
jgi:hypothetical protein